MLVNCKACGLKNFVASANELSGAFLPPKPARDTCDTFSGYRRHARARIRVYGKQVSQVSRIGRR